MDKKEKKKFDWLACRKPEDPSPEEKVEIRKTWDKLNRFVDAIQNGAQPDSDALHEGLDAVMYCMDRLRARRGAKVKTYLLESPEFGIALEYVRGGKGNEKRFIYSLMELTGSGRSTAYTDLEAMTPKAESVLNVIESLKNTKNSSN